MEMFDLYVQESKDAIKNLEWRIFKGEAILELEVKRGHMVLARLSRNNIEDCKKRIALLQAYIEFMAAQKASSSDTKYNPLMSDTEIFLAGGTPWLKEQLAKVEGDSQCDLLA